MPQQEVLLWTSYIKNYDELKLTTMTQNEMSITYMDKRANIFSNDSKLIKADPNAKSDPQIILKTPEMYRWIFNENDFMTDQERKEQHGLILLNQNAGVDVHLGLKEVTE